MIKSCGVGEKELERIHTKNFRNEESENRMKWKDLKKIFYWISQLQWKILVYNKSAHKLSHKKTAKKSKHVFSFRTGPEHIWVI